MARASGEERRGEERRGERRGEEKKERRKTKGKRIRDGRARQRHTIVNDVCGSEQSEVERVRGKRAEKARDGL